MFTVVVPPLQAIVPDEAEAVRTVGSVTVIDVDAEHPRESVTVYVYVPAATFANAPSPEYAGVPPFAKMFTVVVPPLQAIVPDEAEAVRTVGSVTVIDVDAEHPRESVTVYVYVPAATFAKAPSPE
jgi:hypothetical protein